MRVKCDACFRGVPSLADGVAALMPASPLLGVGGAALAARRGLWGHWVWGTECWLSCGAQLTQSCSNGNEQRLPAQSRSVAVPCQGRAVALLAGPWQPPASAASAGAGTAGTSLHPTPVPWQGQLPPTSEPALMPRVGAFRLFWAEPKAPSPLQQ